MKKFHVTGIRYETDGVKVELPSEMDVIAEDEDMVVDIISGRTGWLIKSVEHIAEIKDGKEVLSVDDAQAKLLEAISKTELGDDIYELAEKLRHKCIERIEKEYDIDCSDLSSGESWHDNVFEETHDIVYEAILKFLTAES